jgi:hypothetical protein
MPTRKSSGRHQLASILEESFPVAWIECPQASLVQRPAEQRLAETLASVDHVHQLEVTGVTERLAAAARR